MVRGKAIFVRNHSRIQVLLVCLSALLVMWQLASCGESSNSAEKNSPNESSGTVRLTNDEVDQETPTWSPDGKKIAFVACTHIDCEIYAMNTDGTDITNLSNNPAPDMLGFGWSPDGKRIAFLSNFRTGELSSDIYIMNSDGSNQVRLTNSQQESKSRGNRWDWSPYPGISWSPDGNEIVFSGGWSSANPNAHFWNGGDIYVIHADGSGLTNLTNSKAWTEQVPAWSPDGTKIAFGRSPTSLDTGADIYVMSPDGSNLTNLTSDLAKDNVLSRKLAKVSDFEPDWSPDGKRIAFTSDRRINSDIYIMDANGSNLVNLTHNKAADSNPSWSPDGHKIAFISDRDRPDAGYGRSKEVYVMNVPAQADGP
jgi:Tol biopolymer transport system component